MTPISHTLYRAPSLRTYWVQIDEFGNTIGPWVDVPSSAIKYFSYIALMQTPILGKKSSGTRSTAESMELRLNARIFRKEVLAVQHHVETRLQKLERAPPAASNVALERRVALLEDTPHLIGDLPAKLIDDISLLKRSFERFQQDKPASGEISAELRAELNQLGKGIRKHTLIVHSAPYVGTPALDASAILSTLGDLDYFGEFRAHRRGRKPANSAIVPLLAIMFTSEIAAVKAMEKYGAWRKQWLKDNNGARLPFKIEQDLPRELVQQAAENNKIIAYWREKKFGDIRRHGERIVYFVNNKRIGDIPRPEGSHPWPDPILPTIASGANAGPADSHGGDNNGAPRKRLRRGASTVGGGKPRHINLIVNPPSSSAEAAGAPGSSPTGLSLQSIFSSTPSEQIFEEAERAGGTDVPASPTHEADAEDTHEEF